MPAFAAALLLAGCSIGPDQVRPETVSPAEWTGKPGTTLWPSSDWWQEYRMPDLDALMWRAEQANFDLAAAVARIREADAQLEIAAAPLLPAIQGTAGAARSRNLSRSTTTKSETPGYNNFQVGFTASYEIDFWGKNADAANSAGALADASRFDRETVALTVTADVADTYFTVIALQDRLALARRNLANAEQTLEAFKMRATVGTASGLDIAQQESVVAEQRAAIPPLEQSLRQNGTALALLIGEMPENFTLPAGTLEKVALPKPGAGVPSGLLTRRPDIEAAEARLASVNADLKAAMAARFPSIVLTGQAGLGATLLSNLATPAGILYSAAAAATQPIFEGGQLEGQVELQRGRWDELVQTYRKTVVSAFKDAEDALTAVEQTAKQEEAQSGTVETAQRAYDITQARLFSGTIDILTVLNTQQTLFQAQDLLIQDKLAQIQASIALFKALGGGWKVGGGEAASHNERIAVHRYASTID
jgi:outer membrane protein, multidrug efflux system